MLTLHLTSRLCKTRPRHLRALIVIATLSTTLLFVGWFFESSRVVDYCTLWIFEQTAGALKLFFTAAKTLE
jgi:hypothetical protein